MGQWKKLLSLAGLGFGLFAYQKFQDERTQKLKELRQGSSVTAIPAGAVEYAVEGEGRPMLVLHGGGGGYEMGLLIGRMLNSDGNFQIIAPSRPGARRTPLKIGRSFPEQTAIFAQLLDKLGIDDVIVVAVSAGGIPALQFAIDYPERCRALILISAVGPGINKVVSIQKWVSFLEFMMSSDFFMWAATKFGMASLFALEGNRPDDMHKDSYMIQIFNNAFPASDWKANVINEIRHIQAIDDMPLDDITAPTLLVHGNADRNAPYEVAKNTASHIRDSKLITIEGGTHMMLGSHEAEIRQDVLDFLETIEAKV